MLPISLLVVLSALPSSFWRFRTDLADQTAKFDQIKTGMSQADVEKILGKGLSKKEADLPRATDGRGHDAPVVRGTDFYLWEYKNHEEIWIGFSKGHVTGTFHYFECL
jgi:hypothetical protein